jgi:hypothetical protein
MSYRLGRGWPGPRGIGKITLTQCCGEAEGAGEVCSALEAGAGEGLVAALAEGAGEGAVEDSGLAEASGVAETSGAAEGATLAEA